MEDSLVNLKLHIIPPNAYFGPLDSTGDGHGLSKVVPLLVEKVAANLGDLIPTVEWTGLVVDATDVDAHVADRWQSVPTQVERGEQLVLGVVDRYLQDSVDWYLEDSGPVMTNDLVGYNQGQDVEVTLRCGWNPAQFDTEGRKGQIHWIAHDASILALIGCITDELPIPYADGRRDPIALLGENGDDGLDGPAIIGVDEMLDDLFVAFLRGVGRTTIS